MIQTHRIPPQDDAAEKAVLGAMILDNSKIDEVELSPDDFYSLDAGNIYRAIRDLHDRGHGALDPVTIGNELAQRDELNVSLLGEVIEAVPHAAHALHYADIVLSKAKPRRLINALHKLLESAYEPTDPDALLDKAEREILAIRDNDVSFSGGRELSDVLRDTLAEIDRRIQNPGITGIQTGFTELDDMTSGLHGGNLIVLAARPAMGKTAFVVNVANNVAARDEAVLFFSLEQTDRELAERLISIEGRVNSHRIQSGKIEPPQLRQIADAAKALRTRPLTIDEKPSRTVGQIAAISRRHHRQTPLSLICIDYVGLIQPEDSRPPRTEQVAQITRSLKCLAKDLDVPVLLLCQLNRNLEGREDKRPRLSDLRESGAIEQDSDLVLMLHRPDAYDCEDHPGAAELWIRKNRNGPTDLVRLTWRKDLFRFDNHSVYEGEL